jgi:hypothetical protein
MRFVDPNDEAGKSFIIFARNMQNHIIHVNIIKTAYTKWNQTKTIDTEAFAVSKFVVLPHCVHVKIVLNSSFCL